MNIDGKVITLDVSGLGIVFHSPQAARHIAEGADYLASHYLTEQQVQSHIQKGTIVGFGTGSPGRFILKFHSGYPNEEFLQKCEFKLRLGLDCRGELVCFRDLYELMEWHADCPAAQTLELEDGYYHITLCSNRPVSGMLGDNQETEFYLQKLGDFPSLRKAGIPTLCM